MGATRRSKPSANHNFSTSSKQSYNHLFLQQHVHYFVFLLRLCCCNFSVCCPTNASVRSGVQSAHLAEFPFNRSKKIKENTTIQKKKKNPQPKKKKKKKKK